MLKKILLALAGLLALILIIAAFQPNEFRVKRSAMLAAPPNVLFEQVNNHHNFNEWNPFLKIDPASKITYSGPEAGVGAVCSWQGNSDVGAGTATIIESKPGELVRLRMDWKEPMTGTSTVDFTFKPEGGKTLVTWDMYGPSTFPGKLMGLFINCDKMCGDQFEKGLANLGALTSSAPTK